MRATAIADVLGRDLVAVEQTAAWVWGAQRNAELPLTFSTRGGRRAPRTPCSDTLVHEYRFARGDLHSFDALRVTTPIRTIIDLLRAPRDLSARDRATCRLLALSVPGGLTAVRARLLKRSRPYRSFALQRLASLEASAVS